MTLYHTVTGPATTRHEPGDLLVVAQGFWTLDPHDDDPCARCVYGVGDTLVLVERTEDAPYGHLSPFGNWVVRSKFGESVWSGIGGMIARKELIVVTKPLVTIS